MINLRLWLGMIFVGILIVVACIGPELTPYSKNDKQIVGFVKTNHGKVMKSAPFPPSSQHLFGTDIEGDDIYTLLLYGAKYTLFTSFFVAVARVLIGGGLGLWNGIHDQRRRAKQSFDVLGSFPTFLLVYFVMLGVTINTSVSTFQLVLFQGFLMTIIGVPGVFGVVRERTAEVKKKMYVQASFSLGAHKIHVLKKHVFPQIRGNLIILFLNEMILVLALMGQLGIFHIFLGGTTFKPNNIYVKYLSKTDEWAGIVGQVRSYFLSSQWVLIFPLCALIFTILAFYLLSSGLEQLQWKKYKKTPYL